MILKSWIVIQPEYYLIYSSVRLFSLTEHSRKITLDPDVSKRYQYMCL